jgi:hypothetical protein
MVTEGAAGIEPADHTRKKNGQQLGQEPLPVQGMNK